MISTVSSAAVERRLPEIVQVDHAADRIAVRVIHLHERLVDDAEGGASG